MEKCTNVSHNVKLCAVSPLGLFNEINVSLSLIWIFECHTDTVTHTLIRYWGSLFCWKGLVRIIDYSDISRCMHDSIFISFKSSELTKPIYTYDNQLSYPNWKIVNFIVRMKLETSLDSEIDFLSISKGNFNANYHILRNMMCGKSPSNKSKIKRKPS